MFLKWSWFCFGRMYENTYVQLTPSVVGKLKYSTVIPTANEKGDIPGPRQLCSHYNDRSHRVVQSKIIFFIRVVYTKAVQYVNIPNKHSWNSMLKMWMIFLEDKQFFQHLRRHEHSWLLEFHFRQSLKPWMPWFFYVRSDQWCSSSISIEYTGSIARN